LMKRGFPMAFTVDGPKGPRYVAKMGPCLLAKKTGNPMLPFLIEVARFWEIKSWDLLQIPKPFSAAKLIFAPAIYVPANADENVLKEKRNELQDSLDKLVKAGEKWRRERICHE
ncbi:MAG: hypothetical protein D6735_15180, partial [Acidobacteria bacterium]